MQRDLDRKIWLYTLLIIGAGLVALYSATYDNVRVTQKIFYDQLVCAGLGVFIMYLIGKVDYRRFYDIAYGFYFFNVVLLILVLVMGRHALGATRWIQVGGISFQPSELSKLALILVLGRYFSDLKPMLSFGFLSKAQAVYHHFLIPLGMTLLLMLLIF
ncbi:MAG: FtsW/RodA/SpoVE family cell cycle protein, partial [Candidatus Omnitrophica bacterium]|nr:FtsW/RodA/SpoVE family cell cycle protein [Candidatus Omnitrophota bacterium]